MDFTVDFTMDFIMNLNLYEVVLVDFTIATMDFLVRSVNAGRG